MTKKQEETIREMADEEWRTAVMYNVDIETWGRIRDALNALRKPREHKDKR
jgi:hypothetical protein